MSYKVTYDVGMRSGFFLCSRKFLEFSTTQKTLRWDAYAFAKEYVAKCDAKAAQNIAKRYSLFL